MESYDVVVIGGGAAGLSAALVLSRVRRRVAVVDAGRPRNAPAAHMQGFLSRDGLPPRELVALGRREVASYGGRLVPGSATTVRRTAAGFDVHLDDGAWLSARRLLVAIGTLTAINLLLGDALRELPTVPRTFVLATVAVPVVMYGVMPQLHRARARLVRR